jgi:hypothetical protein
MPTIRATAVLAVSLLLAVAPASAGAAASGSFDDPVGDTTEFAPDLGATTVTVGDDDVLSVNTRIVPRPPAFWGGCAYYVVGTCVPANMNVTWYFDYSPTAGSVADGGADAKVVVVPARGQTFWESARWDAANGRFTAGARPAAAEDAGGVTWSLRLADLGIPEPATLRVWAVSLYRSYNGLGVLFDYSDMAGPGTVSIPVPPGAAGDGGATPACREAIVDANRLQRKLRRAKRAVAKGGGRKARRRLARLRTRRNSALKAMRDSCATPVDPAGPPPASPPPGCQLVTKPVLQQEGTGIYAPWVIKPEVVVECSK